MNVIFHGCIIVAKHRIDHLIYFKKLLNGIQVSVFDLLKIPVAFVVIHEYDASYKVLLILEMFIKCFLRNTKMFGHVIHGHTFYSIPLVQPSNLLKNMERFIIHRAKVQYWIGGNYFQPKVFPYGNIPIFAAVFKIPGFVLNKTLYMKKSLLLLGLVILAIACSSPDKKTKLESLKKQHDQISGQIAALEKELNTSDKTQATIVSVQPLALQSFEHYIEVQGRIDGNENIGVSPRTNGVVTRIIAKEGDYVRKGQVLAELDADVQKRNLADLQSQLSFVTDLYNKQKALWDQKIGSEVQYLTAKNNKESVENKIVSLKDQINMSSITAPIDGTIEDIPIKVGQMATAGVPAFRVINFSKAKAVADVGEAYSSKINTGDQVKIFLPDFNTELQQNVTFASKFINTTNRTFMVEVELPASQNMVYRANMIAVIRIKDYSNASTIAISQNYIQTSSHDGAYVFIAKDENGKKVARKAYIKTGVTYNGLTEVLSGLTDKDKLITAGYKDLYDGQLIDYK